MYICSFLWGLRGGVPRRRGSGRPGVDCFVTMFLAMTYAGTGARGRLSPFSLK